ncbi:MAG: nucleoid-associated protein YgaU [Pseudohongiellaceae bacterium]|jgi:nucleoid-associated protein YgaU
MDVWPGSSQGNAAAADQDILVLQFGDPNATALRNLTEGVDYHVVQAGDSLSSIAAQRLGDATQALPLAELNGLANPHELAPGQILLLR